MITSKNAHEQGVHHWMAFASDLGLAPGMYPEFLPTKLGNGQPFARGKISQQDGDVIAVNYAQLLGCLTLTVLND